jgi:hypothetical protein
VTTPTPRATGGSFTAPILTQPIGLHDDTESFKQKYLVHVINHHFAAKSVQLWLVRQRVVMVVQKAQARRAYQSPPLRAARLGRRWPEEGRRDARYAMRRRASVYESAQAAAGVRRSREEFAHLDFDDARCRSLGSTTQAGTLEPGQPFQLPGEAKGQGPFAPRGGGPFPLR